MLMGKAVWGCLWLPEKKKRLSLATWKQATQIQLQFFNGSKDKRGRFHFLRKKMFPHALHPQKKTKKTTELSTKQWMHNYFIIDDKEHEAQHENKQLGFQVNKIVVIT